MSSQSSHPLAGANSVETANFIKLVDELLSVDEASNAVASSQAGGTSIFVGTTRDNFNGKTVVSLEYEAYDAMALKEMEAVCKRARDKWPQIIKLAIFHRKGLVPIGEASVITAASAAHRREAIDACHFLIDELKATVPIWKKELYEDGSTWKENKEFRHARAKP